MMVKLIRFHILGLTIWIPISDDERFFSFFIMSTVIRTIIQLFVTPFKILKDIIFCEIFQKLVIFSDYHLIW